MTPRPFQKDEGTPTKAGPQQTVKDGGLGKISKYQYICKPVTCEEKDGNTVVTCHLVGNYPGGPADLQFFFKLERDKIASLEIIP